MSRRANICWKTTKIWITKICSSDRPAVPVLSSSSHTRISFNVSNFSNIRQKCSNSSVCVKCNNCCSHSLVILCLCLLPSCVVPEELLSNCNDNECSWDSTLRFQNYTSFILRWFVAMLYIPPPNWRSHLSTLSHHLGAIFALPPFKFVFINYCPSSAEQDIIPGGNN